ELFTQLRQPIHDRIRRAIRHAIAQQLVIGHLREAFGSLRALLGAGRARFARRRGEVFAQTAIGAHRALLRLRARLRGGFRDVDGNAQIAFPSPAWPAARSAARYDATCPMASGTSKPRS